MVTSKFRLDAFGEMRVESRGIFALKRLLKRELELSISNQMSLFQIL
jgi:hypothetical protein